MFAAFPACAHSVESKLTRHIPNIAEQVFQQFLMEQRILDVWSEEKNIGYLIDLLKDKLSEDGRINNEGCSNATGDKNLARATSERLPGVSVRGGLDLSSVLKITYCLEILMAHLGSSGHI